MARKTVEFDAQKKVKVPVEVKFRTKSASELILMPTNP